MSQRKLRVKVLKDHFGNEIEISLPFKATSTMVAGDKLELIVCRHNLEYYKAKDLFVIWSDDVVDWDTGMKLTIEQLDLPEKKSTQTTMPIATKPKKEEPKSTVVSIALDGVEHDFYVTEYSKTHYEVKCDSLDGIEAVVEYKGSKEAVKGKGAKKRRALIVQAVEEVKNEI